MRTLTARRWWLVLGTIFLAACAAPQVTQSQITVEITVDGATRQVQVAAGTTVEEALAALEITVDPLDRSEPPFYTVLSEGSQAQIIRVEEEFVVEQVVVPFEQQILRNESLPEGETRLVQPGVNGLRELTYRKVIEDGVEVSSSPVKSVIVEAAVPEIVMVGSQTPFTPIPISGRLAYLSAGNAWVMEGTTGNRRPVVTTGDLDGYIFNLSPDGEWLLFSRLAEGEQTINALWVTRVDDDEEELIDLEVENVVHFADWSPTSPLTIAFSTVEPRSAPPGWQANNDLNLVSFGNSGWVSRKRNALEANSGGIYGWWGASFAWDPDGRTLAYARPDQIGVLSLQEDQEPVSLLEITPLQTNSDWAWVPGVAWGPDGEILYTVDHAQPQGLETPEESPLFDLTAIALGAGAAVPMVPEVGMFAEPVPSPQIELPSGEQAYQVAYLQSIFPNQSDTSRYRLLVMDRDGSNRAVLFPPEGAVGLDPQRPAWSPEPLRVAGGEQEAGLVLALVYQNNVWLVDAATGESWQLTGDGLTTLLDWQ